jgi:23S rRNA (uracil1939-C5)-methyltransferase
MLEPGQRITLSIEKPASGGRMIARHEGQIVLVSGAVPGERLVARVERVERRLAFATAEEITEASSDRREPFPDPLCGGCDYSHIAYARQIVLKAEVVRDAFQRIGRLPIPADVDVAPSPERAYRMRARLRVDRGQVGFYREGTHVLCDAAPTGQLSDAALGAARTTAEMLHAARCRASVIDLSENVPGTTRAMSIAIDDVAANARGAERLLEAGVADGIVLHDNRERRVIAGTVDVVDPLSAVTDGRVSHGELSRQPESFFQANRYLLPSLVSAVLDAVPAGDGVLDLYAGVGLFSVALAATAAQPIVAVEGDRASGADLQRNAGQFGSALTIALDSVESYLRRARPQVSTVVVDPPRTGMSAHALGALIELLPSRVVYVSCDPPTLARDARKLVDAGYRLESIRGFDFFPNTSHVESLGVFAR